MDDLALQELDLELNQGSWRPSEEEIRRNIEEHALPIREKIASGIKENPEYYAQKLTLAKEALEDSGQIDPSWRSIVALAIHSIIGEALSQEAGRHKDSSPEVHALLSDMATGVAETVAVVPLAEHFDKGDIDLFLTNVVGEAKDKQGLSADEAIRKYRQLREIARKASEVLEEDKRGIKLIEEGALLASGQAGRLAVNPVVDGGHVGLYLKEGADIARETYPLLLDITALLVDERITSKS